MKTRQDLEFMGRMLDIPADALRIAEAPLRYIVVRKMENPVANKKAQQRIGALLADLSFLLDDCQDEPYPASEPAPLIAFLGFRRGKVGPN